jgi:mannose-1-phosphate guanylyltransferase
MSVSRANFYPVILAGGRGTRFWPLSRKKKAKQLLPLDNPKQTMLQQTVARLRQLAPEKHIWVITNSDLRPEIMRQLPKLDKRHILAEPAGRNTAPAIGLAAFILLREDPTAVLGLFPSDHVIADEQGFRKNLEKAVDIASSGENMVVMGIQPTRAETGYGYIEAGDSTDKNVLRVRRFREKPDTDTARKFIDAGNFYWNSGMFVWSAETLVNQLREHLPNTAKILHDIASTWGTRKFEETFKKLYAKAENISVDYAVAEPVSAKGEFASGLHCIPADIGWNDLGSWAALHEHRTRAGKPHDNVVNAAREFALNAEGNYVHAPGKFVAVVGVKGLVVVETEDALLITTRDASQDVGKVVKYLDEKKVLKLI